MPKRRGKGDGTYFKPAGRRYYRIQFTIAGRKHTETVRSEDEEYVRQILRERLAEVGSGISLDHRKLTFKDLAVALVNFYQIQDFKYSADQVHRLDTRIMPVIGNKKVVEISTSDLEAIAGKMKTDGKVTKKKNGEIIRRPISNAEINRVISIVGQAFRLAKRSGRIRIDPPYFRKLPELRKRTEYWKDSEYPTLLRLSVEYIRPLLQFMNLTGWRPGEVPKLKWKENVDWDRREVRLLPGATKNKKPRVFPFIPELEELLIDQWNKTKALEKKKSMIIPWVFHRNGQQIKDYRRQWYKAIKAGGFAGKKKHDFRSTAARNLRRYGFTEGEIIKLVGWSEKTGRQMLSYYEIV
ncbi:tyrosine-type recombinase/integrase, partial [bacterium]|nr:tyrosine-type recombinase/integrase [bacterium]